ncbi:hypothetical protein VTJ04DRAFT_9756 [Mycothermus thermophilus]|uniref:uncharacterized protein n=1 Tax=Humicola insolens TaxID=85995 RepID=UPI003742D916
MPAPPHPQAPGGPLHDQLPPHLRGKVTAKDLAKVPSKDLAHSLQSLSLRDKDKDKSKNKPPKPVVPNPPQIAGRVRRGREDEEGGENEGEGKGKGAEAVKVGRMPKRARRDRWGGAYVPKDTQGNVPSWYEKVRRSPQKGWAIRAELPPIPGSRGRGWTPPPAKDQPKEEGLPPLPPDPVRRKKSSSQKTVVPATANPGDPPESLIGEQLSSSNDTRPWSQVYVPNPPSYWVEPDRAPAFRPHDRAHVVQRTANFQFARYRQTGENPHNPVWPLELVRFGIGNRQHDMIGMPIPIPGKYRGPMRQMYLQGGSPYAPMGRYLWEPSKGRRETPVEIIQSINANLVNPLLSRRLVYKDVVGWGGIGVVVLFEAVDPEEDGTKREFLVKCNIRQDDQDSRSLQRLVAEKSLTMELCDGIHMVQGLDPPDPVQYDPTQRQPPNNDDVKYIIFLEYYPRGSLAKAIKNVARASNTPTLAIRTQRRFEARHLYHIFLCQVKSLIAMCWPPARNEDLYPGQQAPVNEKFPLRGRRKFNLVHRLPESNKCIHFIVLISDDLPESGHGIMPCFMVSDLGLAVIYSPIELHDAAFIQSGRHVGKHGYYVPEQFTQEFDYFWAGAIPCHAFGPNRGSRIAGRHDWRCNLFQAAQTILILLTGFHPPTPPFASRAWVPRGKCSFESPDGDPFHPNVPPPDPNGDAVFDPAVHCRRDRDRETYAGPEADDPNYRRVWTWGGFILQDDQALDWCKFPRSLRILIAWCMAEDPSYRPGLREVEEWLIRDMERFGWPHENQPEGRNGPRDGNESDLDLAAWVRTIFDTPSDYWMPR